MSTINSNKLTFLRKQARLTVDALADEAKVGRATITRIENGRTNSSNAETVKRLAAALKCRPEDLFAAPDEARESKILDERGPVDFEMSSAAQNALQLVAMRYDENPDTILELAPLLFDLFARESLKQRRKRLAEIEAHREAIAAMGPSIPHLGERLFRDYNAEDIEMREDRSINANDLRASYVMELSSTEWAFVPEGYDDESMNPLVTYLQERLVEVRPAGEDAPSIEYLSRWGRSLYDVGMREALQITAGDEDLAGGIMLGQIPLARMPKALRGADAIEGRLEWMREQMAQQRAKWAEIFGDLNIKVDI